ncbi:TIGR04150 pseudo-rSAM protein [Proteiniphilum sp. X52]|uniref:TIGR04150 pseudo-rSAM protein n=1 Tax=Proteiniphilum sp. X52 TaxID=2382159 RepID=UPI000F0A4658|nr:TIGR04150 pseudo-rSAM protein [Proteiniphilum sp. X52]RNC67100.1 TIGR04150 pseudo-rSAM protein [Proteiniphilum sp. X52]
MKDFIVLFPETFLWFNESEGLFYNSNAKKFFTFSCNELIHNYCLLFNDPANLYSVAIDHSDKQDALFSSWLDSIVKYKIGAIYSIENEEKKPFSLPPILNLRDEIEEAQLDKNKYYSSINIAEFLNEMSFFLSGGGLPDEEREYYKQIIYPYSEESFLELGVIHSFLEKSNTTHLRQVNLICSDQLIYPNIRDLIGLFVTHGIYVTCYMPGRYTDAFLQIIDILQSTNFTLKLYFITIGDFTKIQDYIKDYSIQYNWVFLIKNENDFLLCEKIIKDHNLTKSDILPVLTSRNFDFFEENIFISRDNIENLSLTKQNVFCNQSINSNYWGHLFILPDGNVYGNLNKKPLGSMREDAMELIKREINDPESSWKCTREKVTPCKDCIFRNLCPPPSNYEFYLNRFNLCTIKCMT